MHEFWIPLKLGNSSPTRLRQGSLKLEKRNISTDLKQMSQKVQSQIETGIAWYKYWINNPIRLFKKGLLALTLALFKQWNCLSLINIHFMGLIFYLIAHLSILF